MLFPVGMGSSVLQCRECLGWVVGRVLGNRKGECLSGTRLGSTQHPLYYLRTHSRASFCASSILAGSVIWAFFVFLYSDEGLDLSSSRSDGFHDFFPTTHLAES